MRNCGLVRFAGRGEGCTSYGGSGTVLIDKGLYVIIMLRFSSAPLVSLGFIEGGSFSWFHGAGFLVGMWVHLVRDS